MSDIKLPTVGRIVHFFPSKGMKEVQQMDLNGADVLPGIVFQEWGTLRINISVFFFGNTPVIVQCSVNHKSEAGENENYWDWPEVK